MFAIMESGGKQYRVSPGDELELERLAESEGDPVVFDRVALLADDAGEVKVGHPWVEGARVVGRVVAEGRGPKLVVFKYKPKVNYRRRQGHRQPFTRVAIEAVEG